MAGMCRGTFSLQRGITLRNLALRHPPHVLDYIAPFLPQVMQLPEIRLGGKFSQIYQNERHFFRKFFVFVIFQRHVLYELVPSLQVGQLKIHENDRDDLREFVLAVSLRQRVADGACRVGDDTVADELLARLQRYDTRNAFSSGFFCYFSEKQKDKKKQVPDRKWRDLGQNPTNLTENSFLEVVPNQSGKIGIFRRKMGRGCDYAIMRGYEDVRMRGCDYARIRLCGDKMFAIANPNANVVSKIKNGER